MMIQVLCAESLQSAEYIRQSMHKYLQESWVNQPLQSIYILLNFIYVGPYMIWYKMMNFFLWGDAKLNVYLCK